MSVVECPYHHPRWRNQTQNLLNILRGKLLNNRRVSRFSRAVCVCPEKGHSASSDLLHHLPDLLQWHSKSPTILHESHSIIEKFLKAAQEHPENGAGLVGVALVIKEASEGDYHRLDPPPSPSSLPPVSVVEEQWELSLTPAYLSVFIGSGGQHIKPLCKEHNVTVYFGDKRSRNKHYQSSRGSTVKVTVSGEEGKGDLEGFRKKLTERAKVVQLKREKHDETCRVYHALRSKRLKAKALISQHKRSVTPTIGLYENSKEAATVHFARKRQQRLKPRHPSKSTPHAAISEGHCLNCHAAYSPNQMAEGACTYHSGFLTPVKQGKNRGYRWTCCHRRTAQQHATHDLHIRTGCCTGRHMWRAGKNGTKKSRESKEVSQKEIYLI